MTAGRLHFAIGYKTFFPLLRHPAPFEGVGLRSVGQGMKRRAGWAGHGCSCGLEKVNVVARTVIIGYTNFNRRDLPSLDEAWNLV